MTRPAQDAKETARAHLIARAAAATATVAEVTRIESLLAATVTEVRRLESLLVAAGRRLEAAKKAERAAIRAYVKRGGR